MTGVRLAILRFLAAETILVTTASISYPWMETLLHTCGEVFVFNNHESQNRQPDPIHSGGKDFA
jgi:hypothetical protein